MGDFEISPEPVRNASIQRFVRTGYRNSKIRVLQFTRLAKYTRGILSGFHGILVERALTFGRARIWTEGVGYVRRFVRRENSKSEMSHGQSGVSRLTTLMRNALCHSYQREMARVLIMPYQPILNRSTCCDCESL